MLRGITKIAVVDRTTGFGAQGAPLWLEVNTALGNDRPLIKNYIAGLAGRDISTNTMENIFTDILAGQESSAPVWIDCKENPMDIREALLHV